MSVPTKRKPKHRVRTHRAHNALKDQKLNTCPSCDKKVVPHRACASCGTYRGRKVKVKA